MQEALEVLNQEADGLIIEQLKAMKIAEARVDELSRADNKTGEYSFHVGRLALKTGDMDKSLSMFKSVLKKNWRGDVGYHIVHMQHWGTGLRGR